MAKMFVILDQVSAPFGVFRPFFQWQFCKSAINILKVSPLGRPVTNVSAIARTSFRPNSGRVPRAMAARGGGNGSKTPKPVLFLQTKRIQLLLMFLTRALFGAGGGHKLSGLECSGSGGIHFGKVVFWPMQY